jgi:hypothetical protein
MGWTKFKIDSYQLKVAAAKTKGYQSLFGYITLYWDGHARANLWFYLGTDGPTLPNGVIDRNGPFYYARFYESQFPAVVDLLRNEEPAYFHWNQTTLGAFVGTAAEPVGEEESG